MPRNCRPPWTSLFRPSEKKIQRQLKFKTVLFDPDGQLRAVEQPGPGSYQAWRQCYALLRTTLLLLTAVTPTRLDAHSDHIRMLHERYGSSCWGLLYQADVKMWAEGRARISRKALADREDCRSNQGCYPPAVHRLIETRSRGVARGL